MYRVLIFVLSISIASCSYLSRNRFWMHPGTPLKSTPKILEKYNIPKGSRIADFPEYPDEPYVISLSENYKYKTLAFSEGNMVLVKKDGTLISVWLVNKNGSDMGIWPWEDIFFEGKEYELGTILCIDKDLKVHELVNRKKCHLDPRFIGTSIDTPYVLEKYNFPKGSMIVHFPEAPDEPYMISLSKDYKFKTLSFSKDNMLLVKKDGTLIGVWLSQNYVFQGKEYEPRTTLCIDKNLVIHELVNRKKCHLDPKFN